MPTTRTASASSSTRGREQINVREQVNDSSIGYNSIELLLIALGNCTLDGLLNQPLLLEADVVRAEATLDAEMASNPRRVVKIEVDIDLEVADESLFEQRAELDVLA
jgi:hypothetical protein